MKKIDGKERNTAKEVLQLNLTNLNMFCLIKKLLDTKWGEIRDIWDRQNIFAMFWW